MNATFFLLLILSYLIGSLSAAIIVCKIMKLPDPRTMGSGNPGATNVLRSGSKTAAVATLLGDALKGWIAVFIAAHVGVKTDLLGWIALAVILGHVFPVFFRFQGGKGVATLLGALIAWSPSIAFAWMITWLITAVVTRYSSLAALLATIFSVFYFAMMDERLALDFKFEDCLPMTIIAALIVWRHRKNIKKLLSGVESKIGKKG